MKYFLNYFKMKLFNYEEMYNFNFNHLELEELVTKLENLIIENTQLKAITQGYNSYLQDSNCDTKIIIADSEYFDKGFFKENFIPKSKVKEKMKKYEWALNGYDCTIADYKQSQDIGSWIALQQLLEGKEDHK